MKRALLKFTCCIALAWLLSQAMLALLSYLQPVTLRFEVRATTPQSISLFYQAKLPFHRHPVIRQKFTIYEANKWKTIVASIPRHQALHIRMGFSATHGEFAFQHVTLDGHPLDLTLVNAEAKRNVRACEPWPDDIVNCRVAGENSYFSLPPAFVKKITFRKDFIFWEILFFALAMGTCLWLYERYSKAVFAVLKKHYSPSWLLYAAAIGMILCWLLFKYHAFYARLEAICIRPSFEQFFWLTQANALTMALLGTCLMMLFYSFPPRKYIKWLAVIAGSVVLTIELADAALVQLLNARLLPQQALEFGPDLLSTAGPFIKSFFKSTAGIYAVICLLAWVFVCVSALRSRPPLLKHSKHAWLVIALCMAWYFIPVPTYNPLDRAQIQDWPHVQMACLGHGKASSVNNFEPPLPYTCVDGLNKRQNVMIILIESLSSYMSDYFSQGDENLVPHYDKLAREHIRFLKHHATNFDTVQSLFSILTGIPPLHAGPEYAQFKDPKFFRHTLPNLFKDEGYFTALFTSASLVYSKDDIIARTGFDKISQDTDPFYTGHKRFVFNSVPDDVLYARVLKHLQEYTNPAPYLLIVETTTTHSPYIDPKTGQESVEGAFAYADQALHKFVDDLQENHLLDNTLLVITSDHRAMLPMDDQQVKRFGETAESAIPLIILAPQEENLAISKATTTHIDLAPSLAYLNLSKACFHPQQENMFDGQKSQRESCTFFQSFLNRYEIIVDCQGQVATLCLLDRQSNDVCKGKIPVEKKEQVSRFISWVRSGNRY